MTPEVRIGILARLRAAAAVSPRRLTDPIDHLAWIDSGAPFVEAGIHGFFDGLPGLPASAGAVSGDEAETLRAAASATAREPLGAAYMKLSPRAERRVLGEHYTPRWLVEITLDRAGFTGSGDDGALMDPMCGAGAFLAAAVARLRRSRPDLPARDLVAIVHGLDVNPLAVLMARTVYLEAIAGARRRSPIRIPVDCADAILGSGGRGPYATLVGNPPWVGWESLAASYRRATRPLWHRHGLFAAGEGSGGGMGAILGRGRKDLAMLATYAVAQDLLAPAGRLAFVMSQSVLKSAGAGAGFRRFVLSDGTPLGVRSVDDLGDRTVFAGTGTKAMVISLIKGTPTRYPVSWRVWPRGSGRPREEAAEPVDASDSSSAWLTAPRGRIGTLRRMLGPSPYRARAGAYTGGANGVFWVRMIERYEDGTCLVRNMAEAGLRRVATVEARVESGLIYPLLRAADVRACGADPSSLILLAQDPHRRRGIEEALMASEYPLALAYLRGFRDALAERRDRGTRSLVESGAPFYSMFSVSPETLSPWKVVWPRIAARVSAAAVGPRDGRPVVPQETCTFVACDGGDPASEARFLAGILSGTAFNEAAAAFAAAGGKSFGAPHLLRHIAVPRYDAARPEHRALADLVGRLPGLPEGADLDAAVAKAWPAAASLRTA